MFRRSFFLATALLAACLVEPNHELDLCKEDTCDRRCGEQMKRRVCTSHPDTRGCDGVCSVVDDANVFDADAEVDGATASSDASVDALAPEASAMCTRNSDCSSRLPVCEANTCRGCKADLDCAGRGVCDTGSGTCVECTSGNATACTARGDVCRSDGNSCAECNTGTDCREATPHCGDHRCTACVNDDDCARFGKVCDGTSGQCVQCTGNNVSRCGGEMVNGSFVRYVCNGQTSTCTTGILPKSADLCESCVSDAQCGKLVPSLCKPTTYGGKPMGFFCLPTVEIGATCAATHHPWNVASSVASIDGIAEPTCQLEKTTCPALLSRVTGTRCSSDEACGANGVADGICAKVPAQPVYICTIPCSTNNDCFSVGTCDTANGYCNLQG